MLNMGKLEKMWIESYADDQPGTAPESVDGNTRFVLLVNPETIARKFEVEYSDGNLPNTNQQPKYFRTKPEEFKLDILFDGTGVVKDSGFPGSGLVSMLEDSDNDVSSKIETLKKFCYKYDGETHKPFYVKICWGSADGFFKGILTGLDIDYKLFRPDGKPIRAMAHLSLISSVHPQTAVLLEDNHSPDITHQRVFKGGDKFTLLAGKIYGDPNYYTDVARANGMLSYRRISQGSVINFPPLK